MRTIKCGRDTIILFPHANERITERGILDDDIRNTYLNHDIELPGKKGRISRIKQFDGYQIKITI